MEVLAQQLLNGVTSGVILALIAVGILPRWRFTHISDEVLPALRDQGVSGEQIHTMLVENPRAYFSRT